MTPKKLRAWLIVPVFLFGYAAMALSASRSKSVAFDELAHLTAGYVYWEKSDFRFQPENGNFSQRWAALPFLFTSPALPPASHPAWESAQVWTLGAAFSSRRVNDPDALLFQGRCAIALLGALLALLVFLWAQELHGTGGGYVALTLAVFCPALLAHGSLATSDMAFTCALLGATWSVWKLLHRITTGRLLLSVLATSLLFLTKMSAPLFVPCVVLIAIVRVWRGEIWVVAWGTRHEFKTRRSLTSLVAALIALHVAIGWLAIWTAYHFRFAPAPPGSGAEFGTLFTGGLNPPIRWLHRLAEARALPKAYLYGYEFVLRASVYRSAFFNGEYGFGGWPAFFPYAFLVKTPLSFFPLFAIALWLLVRRCIGGGGRALRYALTPLIALLLVFGTAAITASLNIGHRHILPLLPVFYILAGAAWPAEHIGKRWLAGGVIGLCVGFAVESWLVRPHYLAYFNRFAGGPANGWRHLVDSSLDWGMDLPALRDWLRANRENGEPVHFGYFGAGTPSDYGIEATSLATAYGTEVRRAGALAPGLYAVSATLLQQVYPPFPGHWNKTYEARYQEVSAELAHLYALPPLEGQRLVNEKGEAYWAAAHQAFNDLRCGRLCAWLRKREPLANVAHTILVWRLSAEDLRDAQLGPPAELAEAPVAFPPALQ